MRKRIVFWGSLFIFLMILAGCNTARSNYAVKSTNNDKVFENEVVIPVIFLMNTVTGEKANEELVNDFNVAFKGRYRVEVEWMAGDEAGYRSKLKFLNSINQLPAVITDVGFDPSFYNLLVTHNRIVNIMPYLEADREFRECFYETTIAECIEENGTMYLVPLNNQNFYSGIFYNKSLFEKAGIRTFPKTWEELFLACNSLKEIGVAPFSLHTTGTAWIPMLFSTAFLGTLPEGRAFMKQGFPDSYDTEEFKAMMQVCKRLFEYTTVDAIDGDFDMAAWHFYEEETAMIANGNWMIGNFHNASLVPEDFAAKIGFYTFPQNVLVGSREMTAWAICSDYSEEVIKGAIEFMKFRVQDDNEKMMSERESIATEEDLLMTEYFNAVDSAEVFVPNYQLKWNTVVQNEVFIEDLPKYLNGTQSLDEFIEAMNLAVKEYRIEQGEN